MKERSTFFTALFSSLLALGAVGAHASNFPNEPIRVTVPFAPGGGTDLLSRTIVNKMAEQTGWTMVVENRPGAAGTIAMNYVSRARPDGHDLVLGQLDTVAIAPAIYKNVRWDPIRDFQPIGLMATSPLLLVSNAKGQYQDLPMAIKAAKELPGKLDYASPGIGSISHLAVALLEQEAGIEMQHIPYKGAGPAMADLLGERVSLYAASVAAAMPQIQSKNVQPLAVTGASRSAALPNTPTISELGYPAVEIDLWYGLFAPAGVEPEKIEMLHEALNNALRDPEIVAFLATQGLIVSPGKREVLAELVKRDVERWPAIVERAGVAN
ncbi:tripartite tricarboxylate transporter substrate binding protein [Pollutimonas bauzanensis]|uniref:Bug family tripartite tricarboxylate transporter substrate binding protein n=1 Tax=Pollutimonas bauzanensis TaxID=658167 RepID=UPI003341760C